MKKYFINYNINRQHETTSARDVLRFLRQIERGDRQGRIATTEIEVGRLKGDEWISDRRISAGAFLAGAR